MKLINNYIAEKLQINKDSKNSINSTRTLKGIEIINKADCKALPYEYINSMIDAWIASPLKKDCVKIEVRDAKSYFDNDEVGKDEYRINSTNLNYLYCSDYPAVTITWDGKLRKRDTIMQSMPLIHMPLILTDDEDLFTKRNSSNVTGTRDVEYAIYGFHSIIRLGTGTVKYTYTIIYLLRKEATNKLLPLQEFHDNLLNFYKMNVSQRKNYLEELEDKFYTDDRRGKYGGLELDSKRKEECSQHRKLYW